MTRTSICAGNVEAAMQCFTMLDGVFNRPRARYLTWNYRNQSAHQAMMIRLRKSDDDEPRRGRNPDATSAESGMIVADAHSTGTRPAVKPDRRLRNWILLANLLAWVGIIALVRWLFV